jgi:DNA-binding beta-propeller fold protein YncE
MSVGTWPRVVCLTLVTAACLSACGRRSETATRSQHDTPAAARVSEAARGAVSSALAAGAGPCAATPTSLTPASWQPPNATAAPPRRPPAPGLRVVAEIPLPGPANRFDYQSLDPASGRLWISHMDADRVVVFDVDSGRVVGEVPGLPRVTGVWAVPTHHHVYASAAGAHEVAVLDDRTLRVVARVGGVRFPDGIAYAPEADRVFVSDESGHADLVIDAGRLKASSTIPLGGEAGNTHYDSVSKCVLVAVQTRNQLVAIDPASARVVARYDVPGVDGPHGFTLDEARRLAFVTGEGNAALAVVDLRTMRVTQRLRVGEDPDVLAWDPGWRRLYVGAESGVLSAFWAAGDTLLPLGDLAAPHAHTVSVDPRTHRVYLPLQNVGGRPVLRVLEPSP